MKEFKTINQLETKQTHVNVRPRTKKYSECFNKKKKFYRRNVLDNPYKLEVCEQLLEKVKEIDITKYFK